MHRQSDQLRVALIAGTLAQGGAEKQLFYTARALQEAGAEVRLYCLTRGEFYEARFREIGLPPIFVGRVSNPIIRLCVLWALLLRFRPHVVQSGHAFTNIHAAIVGRALGIASLGAIRSSLTLTHELYGRWTRLLISTPAALLVNSIMAINELADSGLVSRGRLYLVLNAIDLQAFDLADDRIQASQIPDKARPSAILLGRLVEVKRVDRFLRALALARSEEPALRGVIVGDGPARPGWQALAAELGLSPSDARFVGQRDEIVPLLRESNMLVLCSDEEGFPNVLLEAMAASLPVIATPAGDSSLVIQEGASGYIVEFDDVEGIAERMVRLVRSPELASQLGETGRIRVEQLYSVTGLASKLLAIYRQIAERQKDRRLLNILEAVTSSPY